jgi:hypothetical protein
MKKYIIPAIKTKSVEMDELMAALSKFDEEGDEGQFGKQNYFDEDDEEVHAPKVHSIWDVD